MIYGIIASAGEGQLPPPAWEGPLQGTFDFINGLYNWQGATLTADQVIDRVDWIGQNGLAVPEAANGAVIIHSGICDLIAGCQFTIVFEVETTGYDREYILSATDATGDYFILLEYYSGNFDLQDTNNVGSRLAQGNHDYHAGGWHRIAATRVDAGLSISSDGNDVEIGGESSTMPVVGSPLINFQIGGGSDFGNVAVTVHWMKVYEAMSDVYLPGLSTL